MRGGPYSDMAILCHLLDHGPATTQELQRSINRSDGATHYAIQRLLKLKVIEYAGYAPRKPGANHIPARLLAIGPRVRRGVLRAR